MVRQMDIYNSRVVFVTGKYVSMQSYFISYFCKNYFPVIKEDKERIQQYI